MFGYLLLVAAQPPAPPPPEPQPCDVSPETMDCGDVPYLPSFRNEIVVTAALVPVHRDESAASVTTLERDQIDALGFGQATDLIRLSPGVSVATSGGEGSQAQVRIRGSEANHSLVFIDGIAFNDLAANNQARFETFTGQGLERIELIRGPQSALWGSEALGGVVAMATPEPRRGLRGSLLAEAGSFDSWRGAAVVAAGGTDGGVSGTLTWAKSDGIDILGGGGGDRDGFENLTASLKGIVQAGPFEIGAVGRYIHHQNAFDGFDANFRRADSDNESTAETHAVRGWVGYGMDEETAWSFRLEAQHLDSGNRNRDGLVRTNDSYGRRTRYRAQGGYRFDFGGSRQHLIVAVEREEESFGTRDLQFGGASDRDLQRARTALVAEWRGQWGDWLATDVAVRHDDFSRFDDATTLRAQAEARLGRGLSLVASYGEGIAQPSFVDLFGFDTFSRFIGNPDLKPERSTGYEAGLRYRRGTVRLEAVAFSNDLTDEIVEDFNIFPNYTVVNAPGQSRRRGIELSAEWRPIDAFTVSANYTYLDAAQPEGVPPAQVREIRRPRHMANLYANWRRDRLTLGGALSYVGERTDVDFDLFPSPTISLDAYVLASARVAYRITNGLEAFARAENLFDESYSDVVGYATPGRTVHAGIRLAFGD